MSDKIANIDTINSIFNDWETAVNGQARTSAFELRKQALQAFSRQGFPHRKIESWKYTNLEKVLKRGFTPIADFSPGEIAAAAFDSMLIDPDAENVIRIVFIDGHFHEALSEMPMQPGLNISTLKENKALLDFGNPLNEGLIDLNTAFAQDGAVIEIDDRAIIEYPVEIYNITTCPGQKMIQPRHSIRAGRASEATIIESYHNICVGQSFTNSVTTIKVAEDARLTYFKIEHPKRPNTFIIDNTLVDQAANSLMNLYTLTLSGALVRNNLHIRLSGEHAESHMYGLYMLKGNDHADNRTVVDHAVPNCMSNELYKGILDDTSTGVFNGKIIVQQDAQKTNAYQNNRNILVSDEATINTMPQLEIYADDVKCSHGATSAQIEDNELFYLRSRGIGKEKARALLMYAFAAEVWEHVRTDAVMDFIRREVSHALGMDNALELE
jgi:Fe-S cluster assembly protein SufD